MASHNQHARRIQDDMGFLWPLLLVLCGSVALPTLLLGLLIQRMIGVRPWSFPLWFVLTGVGAVLTYVLYTHGLDRLLLAQLTAYVRTIKIHHADISQWNIGLLWSNTWPVWLRTLLLTPIVILWREIGEQMHGERGISLEKQERQRQQRIARSKKRAARRVGRPERLPEELEGQMVVGVTIDDEYAE